jgi:hypothetical protein
MNCLSRQPLRHAPPKLGQLEASCREWFCSVVVAAPVIVEGSKPSSLSKSTSSCREWFCSVVVAAPVIVEGS